MLCVEEGSRNAALDKAVTKHSGQDSHCLDLADQYDLEWRILSLSTTAIAGHILGIHPFDQPNVQESKDNTGTSPRDPNPQA
ncbi:MAG: hypothetical protein U0231_19715 [Nitrospiraceae bacterium]